LSEKAIDKSLSHLIDEGLLVGELGGVRSHEDIFHRMGLALYADELLLSDGVRKVDSFQCSICEGVYGSPGEAGRCYNQGVDLIHLPAGLVLATNPKMEWEKESPIAYLHLAHNGAHRIHNTHFVWNYIWINARDDNRLIMESPFGNYRSFKSEHDEFPDFSRSLRRMLHLENGPNWVRPLTEGEFNDFCKQGDWIRFGGCGGGISREELEKGGKFIYRCKELDRVLQEEGLVT